MTTLPLGKSSSSGLFAATCRRNRARRETEGAAPLGMGRLASLMDDHDTPKSRPSGQVAARLGQATAQPRIQVQGRQVVPFEPLDDPGLAPRGCERALIGPHEIAQVEVFVGGL